MAGSSRGQNPQRVKMTKAKHNFFLSRQLTSEAADIHVGQEGFTMSAFSNHDFILT